MWREEMVGGSIIAEQRLHVQDYAQAFYFYAIE